jgi:hypothetical protein
MTAHEKTHKLAQAFADLELAINEVDGFVECDRKQRALCFIREAHGIIKHIVDSDMVKPLINDPMM